MLSPDTRAGVDGLKQVDLVQTKLQRTEAGGFFGRNRFLLNVNGLKEMLGVCLIVGLSIPVISTILEKSNAQAREPHFPDPFSKPEFNLETVMPSQRLFTEQSKVTVSAETRAPIDTYGPEMTLAELEAANIKITARDYIKDASGNTVKQIVVLDNNIVYESDDSPQNTFPSFKAISQLPVKISSMISSSDGQITLAGGAIDHINQKTRMFISYDGRKTWKEIIVPADFDGTPADLVRFTDQDFFGTTLTGEGAANQFIARIDPIAQSATIIPVDMQAGALQNLDMTALDTASRTATIVSNRYLQYGLAVSTVDYSTGIGTAQMITRTLLTDGRLINLGYVYGTGVYTDTLGDPRVSTSNVDRNTLYDFNLANPLDGTATGLYYANLCDNKGLPNYGPGTLSIFALDVSVDSQGNKKTKFGGSRSSTVDGSSRAIFGVVEEGVCLDLEPNQRSNIPFQQNMQRMRINNEWGDELGIRNLGKAFVDENYDVYYTDRGLGSPLILPTPTPTPTPYRLYLPAVFRTH